MAWYTTVHKYVLIIAPTHNIAVHNALTNTLKCNKQYIIMFLCRQTDVLSVIILCVYVFGLVLQVKINYDQAICQFAPDTHTLRELLQVRRLSDLLYLLEYIVNDEPWRRQHLKECFMVNPVRLSHRLILV